MLILVVEKCVVIVVVPGWKFCAGLDTEPDQHVTLRPVDVPPSSRHRACLGFFFVGSGLGACAGSQSVYA